MNVLCTNNLKNNLYTVKPQNKISFGVRQSAADSFERFDNKISHVTLTPSGRLSSVVFSEDTTLANALQNLGYTKNKTLETLLIGRLHPLEEIRQMHGDISKIKDIKDIKIKSLMALGATALVFETEDGNALKLTPYDHFPSKRQPADFDLPCFKKGKSGYTYYYLQEKITQDDLAQDELRSFVKNIKKQGYKMKDYLLHYTPENVDETIRTDQFGRAGNGKIYLIDPGCAIPSKELHNTDSLNIVKKALKYFGK
ncbi:MAG: hypothetical protein KH321_02335 [Clostridium sp.]|nr:hypothetical protein [Clostridium sp.]